MSLYLPQSPPLHIVSHAPQFNFRHCLPGPWRHLSLQLFSKSQCHSWSSAFTPISISFYFRLTPWPLSTAGSSHIPSALIPCPCTKTRELFTWSYNIFATLGISLFCLFCPSLLFVSACIVQRQNLSAK